VLFQLLIPGLLSVSLLESELGFKLVTQRKPENDHMLIYSLWETMSPESFDVAWLNKAINSPKGDFSTLLLWAEFLYYFISAPGEERRILFFARAKA
jgi:hypothetical protein